ncbi:MAG: T9SS type A sorting domain-containing protein [Ignavibacteria bacterium]|nr:T9SS type A sorting domain-containing protein [Ignavibacteria bacterium]
MKYLITSLVFLCILSSELYPQVQQEWVRFFDGQFQYYDEPAGIVSDANGNVYIGGTSAGNGRDRSSLYEYVTFKYSPGGQLLWLRRYNGNPSEIDEVYDLNINAFSDVFVTGSSSLLPDITYDWATIKYNSNGDEQWIRTYGNPGWSNYEAPRVMKIDGNSNIFIAGNIVATGTSGDMAVIKYSTGGQLLWQRIYNRLDSTTEKAGDMVLDNSGNIYVVGCSLGPAWWQSKVVTLKYDANGTLAWSNLLNTDTTGTPGSVLCDISGNVYITGHHNRSDYYSDEFIVKYNSSGQQLWYRSYPGPKDLDGTYELPGKIHQDINGNIFFLTTKFDSSQGFNDISVRKLSSNGVSLDSALYNSPANRDDLLRNSIIDKYNNLYLIGSSHMGFANGGYDLLVLKYNSECELEWSKLFAGPGSQFYNDDYGISICLDSLQSVFVTGISENGNSSTDIVTIKYSQTIGIDPISSTIPDKFALYQNYPNPFNPSTKIKFDLPESQFVRVNVHDILGKEVSRLVNQMLIAGKYSIDFNNSELPTGVYFCSFETESIRVTKKMVLLK